MNDYDSFPVQEIAISQLGRSLSESELSGQRLRDVGLSSNRVHQPGASYQPHRNPRHVLFVHAPSRPIAPPIRPIRSSTPRPLWPSSSTHHPVANRA